METDKLIADGGWRELACDSWAERPGPVKGRHRKTEIKLARSKDGKLRIVGYDQDGDPKGGLRLKQR